MQTHVPETPVFEPEPVPHFEPEPIPEPIPEPAQEEIQPNLAQKGQVEAPDPEGMEETQFYLEPID